MSPVVGTRIGAGLAAVFALLVALLVTGCEESSAPPAPSAPTDPGGYGMTYRGKPGIDLGGGLVVGYDGKVSPGFGF